MWQVYRRRVFVTQAFILTLCLLAHFVMKMEFELLVMAFGAMQLGTLFGAHMTAKYEWDIEGR